MEAMAGHSGRAARRKSRRSQSPSLSETPGRLPTPPKPWELWALKGVGTHSYLVGTTLAGTAN